MHKSVVGVACPAEFEAVIVRGPREGRYDRGWELGLAAGAQARADEWARKQAVVRRPDHAGSQMSDKSAIVGRVARRIGPSKSVAEGAVDTVPAAIGEVLAKDEGVWLAGVGKFATRTRCGIVTSFLNTQTT